MRPPRVVVTGATGFVGSAVTAALFGPGPRPAAAEPHTVRVIGRRPPSGLPSHAEWVPGDLASPATLDGCCDGAQVLLHLACSLSSDAEEAHAVNVTGTAALMAEASRAGVRRIIHLSTAAVYGQGPHDGLDVDEVEPAPVSTASRTRLAGERHALSAGATVLRAPLILGPGDRWVVPALAELLTRVPALWDGGRARLSVIDVHDLARLVVGLALVEPAPPAARILHAGHPAPVTSGELLTALAELDVLPPVPGPLDWDACLRRLHETPGRISERQFTLLARDHWYRSDAVWRAAACPPGPGPLARLPRAADFYRETVGAAGQGEG
ncbi:NAD(P)-dependent oxidoreductase [Streptomyces sp. NPDC047973]|uniref:NAD-dependent epimerase/dehydratase family protein n=1 Tax=Streptomyces sp. NPDC047973 TaxID=3155383 RepID=UPI00341BFD17